MRTSGCTAIMAFHATRHVRFSPVLPSALRLVSSSSTPFAVGRTRPRAQLVTSERLRSTFHISLVSASEPKPEQRAEAAERHLLLRPGWCTREARHPY